MPRRTLLTLVLALVAGILGYGATRLALRPPARAADSTEAQLDWLAREFSLDKRARAEVARLQSAYEPICESHCAAIGRAQAALKAAIAADNAAARAAAEAELARLKQICAESTQAHLRAVAAQMPPDQAARFLTLMQPRVAHTVERTGAPALAPARAP